MTTSEIVRKYIESEIERLSKNIKKLDEELEYSPMEEFLELSKQELTMEVLKKKKRLIKKFENRRSPIDIIHEKVEISQIIGFLNERLYYLNK